MMGDRIRPVLAAFACGGLLAAGGCTRTSDGSIEFRPIGGATWGFPHSAPPATTAFPPVPPVPASMPAATPVRKTPPKKAPSRPRPAPAQLEPAMVVTTDPPAPLICQEVTEAGGRVKVVCQ